MSLFPSSSCLRLWRLAQMGAQEIKTTRADLELTMARHRVLLQISKVENLVYM
jgi:hypothetical protein